MTKMIRNALLLSLLICAPAFAQEAAAPAPLTAPATPPTEAAPSAAPEPAAAPAMPVAAVAPVIAEGALGAPIPSGKGEVILFRPMQLMGAALSYTIHDGETPVTKLGLGRYFVAVVDPGTHVFQIKSEAADTLNVEVDAGETYYVMQKNGMGVLLYRPNLSPVDQKAFEATKGMKPAKQAEPASAK